MVRSGIYQIRCLVNNKVYIGSAVDIPKRLKMHRTQLSEGKHHSRRLQHAWNKHGADAFVFEILERIEDRNSLIPIEQSYLDHFKPFKQGVGYNISPTAGSTLGIKRSPEYVARMADSLKGNQNAAGHRLSDETKQLIASKLQGRSRVFTDKHRAALSEALKGKQICKGRKLSEETRKKIAGSLKG